MNPYYLKEQRFMVDDYDQETREWETYEEVIEEGWYFTGEDGPSSPHGPYETEAEAVEGQKKYLQSWYEQNV